MAIFKSPEEITTPENMNKVLKDISDKLDSKLSLDSDGNLSLNGDLVCRDLYANEESVYLGKKKLTANNISSSAGETKARDFLRYSFMMG